MDESDEEQRVGRELEARRKLPQYELKIVINLADEKALQTFMLAVARIIYETDPYASFAGGETSPSVSAGEQRE